jgi:hypothetical protein
MSDERCKPGEPCGQGHDHHEHRDCTPNLCNELVYTFGSNKGCRCAGRALETTGGTHIGYAVGEGTLKAIRIVWSGSNMANEELVVTKNGEEIASVVISGEEGKKCVCVCEPICGCDVINVVSEVPMPKCPDGEQCPDGDDEGDAPEWHPAGCITVSLEIEPKCHFRFIPEGDGVAEAIDTTGTTPVTTGATWFTRTLDTERNNTLGMFATFIDAEDAYELKWGTYIISYQSGVMFDQSVNVSYRTKLQENVNGGGWTDILQSTAYDFNLSGDDGNVAAGRTITYKVNKGDSVKIRIQEMITQDTSVQNATGGAGLVIERIANGITLPHCGC